MSYSTDLEIPSVKTDMYAVLCPRLRVETFTLSSGSVYYWDLVGTDYVTAVEIDGTALAGGVSSVLSAGQFYFDFSLKRLYIRTTDSSTPNDNYVVVLSEVYVATEPRYLPRDPTNSSDQEVFFEPCLAVPPTIKATMSDAVYGLLPTQTSNIQLFNDGKLMPIFDDCSFNLAPVYLYHRVGEGYTSSSFKKIYQGRCGNIRVDTKSIDISLYDEVSTFDQNLSSSYFPSEVLSLKYVDPTYVGSAIPEIFGTVEGLRGVPIAYPINGNVFSPEYAFCKTRYVWDGKEGGNLTAFGGSGTNTTTRTFTGITDLKVGQRIYLRSPSNPLSSPTRQEYVEVLALGTTGGPGGYYVDHVALGSPMDVNSAYQGFFIHQVAIIMDGVRYEAYPKRDFQYSETDVAYIQFISGYETNIGLPRLLTEQDVVFAKIESRQPSPDLTDYTPGAIVNLTNPVAVIYTMLVNYAGVAADRINFSSFDDLHSSYTSRPVRFSAPVRKGEEFPTLKEIIGTVLGSYLFRLHLDTDNKWTLSRVLPFSGADSSIDEYGLINPQKFDISYDEILSDVIVEYYEREVADEPAEFEGKPRRVYATSTVAQRLHKIQRQRTFKAVCQNDSDAQDLANKLSYIFGERRLTLKIDCKTEFLPSFIGDEFSASFRKQIGASFDEETTSEKTFVVNETEKRPNMISITLDDQKGIEDNSGGW
jgi:hypothetical protein